MQAKVNPYLRPLLDALNDMMDFEQVKRFMVSDVIEVIPLAFMRGRTLNESVVILDEAQNTTPSQMLMFLTRLGHDSKMIITGDPSQVDLPGNVRSGLEDALEKLQGIKGIATVELENRTLFAIVWCRILCRPTSKRRIELDLCIPISPDEDRYKATARFYAVPR